jgi:hypothetical protein
MDDVANGDKGLVGLMQRSVQVREFFFFIFFPRA